MPLLRGALRSGRPALLYRRGVILLALALVAWRWLAGEQPLAGEKKIQVVLRYDDLTSKTSWPPEATLIELCRQHQLRATLAVIPALLEPGDSEKLPVLSQAAADGVIEIAQHGWDHYFRTDYDGPRTELAGRSEADQQRRLERGRRRLEQLLGVRVETLVPPWNTYDKTTIGVVWQLEFSVLSAGRRGPVLGEKARLAYLPATCEADQLRQAIFEMRRSGHAGIIVAQFHPFHFPPRGRLSLDALTELLAWLGQQNDIEGATLAQTARRSGGDLGFQLNKAVAALARLTPQVLRGPHISELIYYDSFEGVAAAALEGLVVVALWHLLLPLAAWPAAEALWWRLTYHWHWAWPAWTLLVGLTAAWCGFCLRHRPLDGLVTITAAWLVWAGFLPLLVTLLRKARAQAHN